MLKFQKPALPSRAKLLVLAALVVPFLAACITSQNPLSWTKATDDRILGAWVSEENPKNIMRLNITARGDGNYDIVQTESNEGKPRTSRYVAFLNKGSRASYINLVMEDKTKPPMYMIFEYWFANNQFKVKSMDFAKLKAAIKSGALAGVMNESNLGGDITVTSPGEKLFALVDAPEGGSMFENELVFQRVDFGSEVKAVLDKQAAAWNAGDLDAFMSAYSKSANVSYVSSEGEVRGYDALAERYRKKYGNNKESMGKLSFSGLNIETIGSLGAYAVGRWNLVRANQPDLNGIFTLVLTNGDGGWKIVLDHTSVLAEKK